MCTRILWSSGGEPGVGVVAVARTLDWMEEPATTLAIRARSAHRSSGVDEGGLSWTSRYGSAVTLLYGTLTADGMNEAGLNVNGLYLSESDYGDRDSSRPGFRLGTIVQYLLDTFATVAEAVTWFETAKPQVVAESIGSEPGTAHLSLADRSGDSAVIEFLGGQTIIHHGPQYTVMTNSPRYDEQLARASAAGSAQLPGGADSPERFLRAAHYAAGLPTTADPVEAIASLLSAERACAVPYGVDEPGRPNIAATRWTSICDLTDGRYLFTSSTTPNLIWVDLTAAAVDGGGERLLDPAQVPAASGEVSALFSLSDGEA